MNISARVFVVTYIFNPGGKKYVGICSVKYGRYMFNFTRNCPIAYHVTFPAAVYDIPVVLLSPQHLLSSVFLTLAILMGLQECFSVDLFFISLMTNVKSFSYVYWSFIYHFRLHVCSILLFTLN